MSGQGKYQPRSAFGRAIHSFEENAIAIMLGLMTMITFINVIMRYAFNSLVIWGLEVVLILFAWMVLFGISYGFKITAHLGVDAITNLLSPTKRRILGLVSGAICILYAIMMLKGAWDYWAPFAGMMETTGRWFPTGFNEATRDRAFFETDQVPMLGILRWLEDAINQGETYSKLPRMVPYTILPVACVLILYRVIEVTLRIWRGDQDSLIVSHEAEDAVEEAAARAAKEG
jgi:C4-dicarboxylate transporter DctQ subunit